MCECNIESREFDDLKQSVEYIKNQVDTMDLMIESFKYELVSKLIKPVSSLKLSVDDSRMLRRNGIDTVFDLIMKCSLRYFYSSESRYRRVTINGDRRSRLEAKLNAKGLSFSLPFNKNIKSMVYARLGRDAVTGE